MVHEYGLGMRIRFNRNKHTKPFPISDFSNNSRDCNSKSVYVHPKSNPIYQFSHYNKLWN